MNRLNGVLRGVLAGESWTASLSYFFGPIVGKPYKVVATFDDPAEGFAIDELDDLDAIALGKQLAPGGGTLKDSPVGEGAVAKLHALNQAMLREGDGRREALKSEIASMSARGLSAADIRAEVERIITANFDPDSPVDWTNVDKIIAHFVRKDATARAETINALATLDGREVEELTEVERVAVNAKTHHAVTAVFVNRYAGRLLYAHGAGWHVWDGSRWRLDRTNIALDFARHVCQAANTENKASMGSLSFASGVEVFARADRRMSVTPEQLDADNYLLNTPAGTVDLRTNTLRAADPEERLTARTAVAPMAGTPHAFLRFMAEITMGDHELVEFHQVSLGACLSGAIEGHWMLFWIGQGRNGKNTLGELVAHVMGDYARKIPQEFLMSTKHRGHPAEIANLQGCRLAYSSEVDEAAFFDESRINEVTGDETLSARRMYGDPYTFRRTHKHLVFGNHRPQLRTGAVGVRSRIKLVPFKASFLGREDAELPAKLRAEAGQVLSWLLEGHRKWIAAGRKLPHCAAIEGETVDYFSSQSTTELWISERVDRVLDDGRSARSWMKAGELYSDYVEWRKSRGEMPLSVVRWGETMGKQFVKVQASGARYVGALLKSNTDW
jgi:putative DNA primase/helicase